MDIYRAASALRTITWVNIPNTPPIFPPVPPEIEISPTDKTVNETGPLHLFCNATGKPAPTISWFKVESGKQVDQKEELVIGSVTRDDAGTYMCTASNQAGNASAKAVVEVQCEYATRSNNCGATSLVRRLSKDTSSTLSI